MEDQLAAEQLASDMSSFKAANPGAYLQVGALHGNDNIYFTLPHSYTQLYWIMH